jgi:eukaryotic-like serine/threonine-protein kinase
MPDPHWENLKGIFHAVIALPSNERAAYLDKVCGDDLSLREALESLLKSHEETGNFVDNPAYQAAADLLIESGELRAGESLGHYRIVSLLGEGGMGRVYLAEDTKLHRRVSLKFLSTNFTKDDQRLRRFEQEARAASALNHPNILTIHEIGEAAGHRFIATEFIEGQTLRERLRSGVDIDDALDIAIQVASALVAAHRVNIIHRDIKPENIMIRKDDGLVKVLDFGLAKMTQGKPSGAAVDSAVSTALIANTGPGVVMGTVAYMSPEQARGDTVDHRTDIWSLGVVIYEMVAGCSPFVAGTSNEIISAILSKQGVPPLARYSRVVPERLEEIVEKALTKNRDERYQTSKDQLIDLKRLKQSLELKAGIERSTSPDKFGVPPSAAQSSETKSSPPEGGAPSIHPTSSAEYIVNQVKSHKRGVIVTSAVLLLLVAGVLFYTWRLRKNTASAQPAISSIAVLPFVNATDDPNAEYLSDGISESLTDRLSQLPQLKVIARSSAFKYKGKEIDPQEVARALSVQALVLGRIMQRGDQLQVRAELVDARDKTQVWGEQYSRKAADLQAIQEEMARTIAEKLRLRLTGAQEQRLAKRATENSEAYQLYLNGEFYMRKNGIEYFRKALDYYNQAIALDANFALAYVGRAASYQVLAGNSVLDPKEANAKAKAAAQRALELDETLADAHVVLASIKTDEWDWAGVEQEFTRAIELNPNWAFAHSTYAWYLSGVGRHAEALAEIKRAQELDPLLITFLADEGFHLWLARRYDESIQKLLQTIKLEPEASRAHVLLGFTYESNGMYAEAISEHQKAMSLAGETTSELCYLGYAFAKSGQRNRALSILNQLKKTKEYISPYELATLYLGLEEKGEALALLEKAYAAHDLQMQYLKVDPHLDSIRSESRFAALQRLVGLPQ